MRASRISSARMPVRIGHGADAARHHEHGQPAAGERVGRIVAVADRGQRHDRPPHAVEPVRVLFEQAEERAADADRADQQVARRPVRDYVR